MNKYIATLALTCLSAATCMSAKKAPATAPRIADLESLKTLRTELADVDSLMRNGIMTEEVSGLDYFTGYSYRTLYDWDQYFESIVQLYMGWPADYIKNGVTIFLDNQREDGFIVRSVPGNKFHDNEHVKPFLSQIALLVCDQYGDKDWILTPEYMKRLQKYIDYWLVNMDSNGNGLSEWMSAPHTGMDNQLERAGLWLDQVCEGVDLNSYLVRETRAFARLAEMAGDKQLAAEYRKKSDELAERIRTMMWDDEDGFYYDLKVNPDGPMDKYNEIARVNMYKQKGNMIPVRSISSFAPMFCEVATPEQVDRMTTEYLFNPEEFWTPAPMAALSKSEPWYSTILLPNDVGCSWRANVWIPTNYMVYHGLRNYGKDQLASIVAHYTQKIVKEAGNREYYNSETGEGCGLDPFWGWSLLGHFMEWEDSVPYDVTKID